MRGVRLVIALFLWVVAGVAARCPAHAEFHFAGNATACTRQGNTVDLTLSNGRLQIQVLADHVIRFRFTSRAQFDPAPSYAVVARSAESPGGGAFTLAENPDRWEIATRELVVDITRHPCRVSVRDRAGHVIQEDEPAFGHAFDGNEKRCFKRLMPGEQFYGLGEKVGWLDRRGEEYVMWNSDYPAYGMDRDPLYKSIPFYLGVREHRAYGLFVDNPWRTTFNMGAANHRFTFFAAADGDLDYYLIWGPDPARVVSTYTGLTGRPELPPLWALGYQQSRWSYFPESRVREVAQGFRRRSIPCDVLYLDIDYMDGYRVFTWDRTRFPEPRRMLADLAGQGFKVIPIVDPGVKVDPQYPAAREGLEQGLFARYPDGTPYQGEVWPSWAYFPDFTLEKTRHWWADKIAGLVEQGVQGIWIDMNEPAVWGRQVPDIVRFDDNGHGADHKKIHNVYALCMARATSEGLHRSPRRHLLLTRAAFAGTQRYSAVWTGDNAANEDHLRQACLMPQSMGLGGLAFAGSDVGGFAGTPTAALYTRWMQLGAFTPFFRGHSMKGTPDKEPWALGEDTEAVVRDAIVLRYRLLPHFYNVFHEATRTGLPIMRPMFLCFPQDDACYAREAQSQFMVGDSLLVAPVLSQTDTARRLYLPRGRWLDWWEGGIVNGGRWVTVHAPLDRIPLFLREGGVVPMRDAQQYVGEKPLREMELKMLPGAPSTFSLYEDDGATFAYRQGAYLLTKVEVARQGPAAATVAIRRAGGSMADGKRTWLLQMHGMARPGRVEIQGRSVAGSESVAKMAPGDPGWAWQDGTLWVRARVGPQVHVRTR